MKKVGKIIKLYTVFQKIELNKILNRFLDYEKRFYELIETINGGLKAEDFLRYKAQLFQETHMKLPASAIIENISTMSLSKLSKHNNQSRAKKLGAIMGIAKRSRSIHYTECPSKLNN